MSKHDEKPHHKSEGIKLAGNPEALNEWATEHIANAGPKHKQVLTAMSLKRLYALVQSNEKSTDTIFVLQEGYELTKEKVAEAVSTAPEHEVREYAMGLHVIEWAIKATSKKSVRTQVSLIADESEYSIG